MSDYRLLHSFPPDTLSQQPIPSPSIVPAHRHADPPSTSHSEDLKYIAKYKELKRKVKEIELENDCLHVKILKTKKNIQRLQLERAILYERLSTLPNTNQDPFPSDPGIFHPSQLRNVPRHVDIPGPEGDMSHHPKEVCRPSHTTLHVPLPTTLPHASARYHERSTEDSPRTGMSRSQKVALEPEPNKPPGTISAGSTNGTRTFPFVLEYAHNPVNVIPATAYPTEVRFYPYEMSSHPAQRNARDLGPAERVRPVERERGLKFRHHRPEGQDKSLQRHSPEPTQGGYQYPRQYPSVHSEKARRDLENDHVDGGPHDFSQLPGETLKGRVANSTWKNKANPVLERCQEYGHRQQDDDRGLPPPRSGSHSYSQQDLDKYEYTQDMRDERTEAQTSRTYEIECRGQVTRTTAGGRYDAPT